MPVSPVENARQRPLRPHADPKHVYAMIRILPFRRLGSSSGGDAFSNPVLQVGYHQYERP
jgi:hypothetical protein